ncbi:MAG: PLP-dependent transferase [Acidimicrobiia bacterium]|nr:PLP-dependent transferase [Acidimicrobiia bacterium]MDX2466457.1 PLP-dependent transferase [Acidimicrobiia bacterium]
MERDLFTAALHADDEIAELPDVAPSLRPSTTFEYAAGQRIYSRASHETTERLEAVLGALEGGHCVAYPSGSAAVAAVLRYLRPARVSLPGDVYHGVTDFVRSEAGRGAWDVVDAADLDNDDVMWLETPSNPKCLITDLVAAAKEARARGVITVADATFATPVLQQTLGCGVDFSVHATTKFIGGHSDAMGGVVSTCDGDVANALREARTIDGAVPGTLETWLTLRGIRTLPLRVARQSETALAVARFLEQRVPQVWYPGLQSHPGHEVAKRQMSGFGGVLSFEVQDAETALKVIDRLGVFTDATSLGGVESLADYRRRSDPTAPLGLIRLSIGLESATALIDDLAQALGP